MFDNIDYGAMLVWYLVFVFSTTCHEFAHAFVAHRGGDSTAYEGGVMSLDPTPHIRRSPFGMVIVPLISFLWMGWMVGWASVPYDPVWGKRNPSKQALMSLAGPAANMLLAVLAFIALKVLLSEGVFVIPDSVSYTKMVGLPEGTGPKSPLVALAMGLSIMVNLNVLLCLFNLVPLPPLDGAGVAEGAAPNTLGSIYERMREIPMMPVLGIMIAWKLFAYVFGPVFTFILRLLYPGMI